MSIQQLIWHGHDTSSLYKADLETSFILLSPKNWASKEQFWLQKLYCVWLLEICNLVIKIKNASNAATWANIHDDPL